MIAWGGITIAEAGVESPLLAIDGLQRFKGSGGSRTVIRFEFAPVVQLWMHCSCRRLGGENLAGTKCWKVVLAIFIFLENNAKYTKTSQK